MRDAATPDDDLTDRDEATFLQKPFTVESLARCVRNELSAPQR